MLEERKKDADRVAEMIAKYESGCNFLEATRDFVKEFLDPTPERGDMVYRYEHSLRVSYWGRKIAQGEGWAEEPLVIACLLHDVGYPLLRDFEEWPKHPRLSAEIAEKFLAQIGYDKELSMSICKAIRIHDRWNDFPQDSTPFELSVRDADDLDRFDVMRICMIGRSDIGELSTEELIKVCDKRLASLKGDYERICGSETARGLWKERVKMREQFYIDLKEQMLHTFEMEDTNDFF